jgi:hypothetical protein
VIATCKDLHLFDGKRIIRSCKLPERAITSLLPSERLLLATSTQVLETCRATWGKYRCLFEARDHDTLTALAELGGGLLAIGRSSGRVSLVQAGDEVATLRGHKGCVDFLAKSGQFVVSAGWDQTVRVWQEDRQAYQMQIDSLCKHMFALQDRVVFTDMAGNLRGLDFRSPRVLDLGIRSN